ncbi:NADH-quinone oxidoreductase subunit NuoN [Pelagerythrobacter rhizovicinus]|uniref:NADH-quinone oxidoreductase subunit N n=1 Tax=Pelagerythrobacter rhizovicinus TaxID=2268576 RepID=A0A4Q2KQX9_9SPHN|nr:NADH-quinone oxidoreductase subunit NuoN [Pelagerythrobacter rhizovicinus]RXZ66042.1 NADH-quinone oxidoreductase subunit NuoN [Pelagerythrobacter rhizovicinus]
MDFKASLALIAPEILLSLSALALLLVAAWSRNSSRLVSILAAVALGGAAFLAAPALCAGAMGPDTAAFGGQFAADAFASFSKILIYVAAIGCLMIAPTFFDRNGAMRPEYPVLVLLATLGMGIMVSATDFITLYVGLELNSLAAYVLASFMRTDDRSAEAGLKYFVLGALASGILLYGISLVYGFTGATSFEGARAALAGELSMGALFGLIFVLAGLAFKISAVPFHMWTPDVYEGAPTPVTTFFSTAPKVAAIALTARVALDAFGMQADAWRQIVIFAALASIILGALGAIGQSNLKRLLAYSSINNVGFILIGLAAATVGGVSAMLVYLAIYVAMSLGSFVAVLMLRDAEGRQLEGIADIAGLSRTKPVLALCVAAMMLSLAGIPPLFGFWGKLVVFQAAVEADLAVLAAIGIAASVIGAFYYIKIVKVMYFDEPADVVKGGSDWAHWLILGVTTLFVSPLGYLLTGPLGDLADRAAAALFFVA